MFVCTYMCICIYLSITCYLWSGKLHSIVIEAKWKPQISHFGNRMQTEHQLIQLPLLKYKTKTNWTREARVNVSGNVRVAHQEYWFQAAFSPFTLTEKTFLRVTHFVDTKFWVEKPIPSLREQWDLSEHVV